METVLGTISVCESGYARGGYPGYIVSLEKDGRELAAVLFEVDQTCEGPACKIHVYEEMTDEPICDFRSYKENNELKLEMY